MPLEQNPLTGELFLRLPPPHANIIITPPRPRTRASTPQSHSRDDHHDDYDTTDDADSDESIIVSAMNDPRVYPFLESPPFPYKREHAVDYIRRVDEECRRILSSISLAEIQSQVEGERRERPDQDESEDEDQTQKSHFADGCPFRCIREVVPSKDAKDTKEVLIGDIALVRYHFYEIPPDRSDEKAQAQARNASLPPGHPELIWGIGFWLHPTHHGNGIMTSVLRTIIHDWVIPHMNVSVLKAAAFVGNERSVGVFRKNGFEVEGTVEKGSALLSEARGGGRKDILVLRWVRKDIAG
ncbi:hypothetical protein VTN77DRAFT_6399 [Rasamsonia byssochlamydoides]|uniref:uncharacterized protein n=1 Tax=Rasamsonia byssochlamydoides TaxID=89139 RepID=UPI0037433F92